MKLTPDEQAYVAQRAQWYFDVQTSPRTSPVANGDNCTFTGCGLDDLNRTIGFITFNPGVRVICEVGSSGTVVLGNAYPKYLECDISDVYAIRQQFINYYGSVSKPDAYISPAGGAVKGK